MSTKPLVQVSYKYLLTYQYSSVVYDLTVEFCVNFLSGRELLRMRDQMIQAARSGKQNIAEGNSLQSLESYIKLLGVAYGSLKELLEDYEDFLRQHQLPLWGKDDQRMRGLRDKQIQSLKEKFVKEGGFREKLFRERLKYKNS